MDPVHSGTNWYALDPFQQGLVVSTSSPAPWWRRVQPP